MMETITIDKLIEKTDEVFGNLVLPEPAIHWKNKLEALEAANLHAQRINCLYEMRCEQAETLGFEELEPEECVELLMGEESTHDDYGPESERQQYEWMFNHHTGKDEGNQNWGSLPYDMWRMESSSKWYMPPFIKVEKWRCRMGLLDHLKRPIPYGVVLRMLEIKKLGLFNVFHAIAPVEAWTAPTCIDPIIIASIWELPLKKEGEVRKAGQSTHFFIAQW